MEKIILYPRHAEECRCRNERSEIKRTVTAMLGADKSGTEPPMEIASACIEASGRNLRVMRLVMQRAYGWMPCWRIVFSTFLRCMSFHTARVNSQGQQPGSTARVNSQGQQRTRAPQKTRRVIRSPRRQWQSASAGFRGRAGLIRAPVVPPYPSCRLAHQGVAIVIVFPRLVKEKPCVPMTPNMTASIRGSVICPSAPHSTTKFAPVPPRVSSSGTNVSTEPRG